MKKNIQSYDIVIVGAGLAGLTAAIHLAKLQYKVVLLEKNAFPRHKVCGEYISLEVLEYLKSLDFDPFYYGAVNIDSFLFTSANGKSANCALPLGGFGISRYTMDEALWKIAENLGVQCLIDEVVGVHSENGIHRITTKSTKEYTTDIVIGAQGKRAKLDNILHRSFMKTRSPWLGVKAHYRGSVPLNQVALHHFEGGYCGLSMVENERVNACYLVHQSILDRVGSLDGVQHEILSKNPYLERFFAESEIAFEKPLAISQVYFGDREKTKEGMFFIGDAAGMIHPLAGNGMAIAIHSAKILCELIDKRMKGHQEISQISQEYSRIWKKSFSDRIRISSIIQSILQKQRLSNSLMNVVPHFSWALPSIIKKTHGKKLESI